MKLSDSYANIPNDTHTFITLGSKYTSGPTGPTRSAAFAGGRGAVSIVVTAHITESENGILKRDMYELSAKD